MSTEKKQNVQVFDDGTTVRHKQVVEYTPSTQAVLVNRISQFMWLIVTIITSLLTVRVLLFAIGANTGNAFVSFILNLTDVLVAPFSNIVASPTLNNEAVLDLNAIIAIIVYLLAGWALIHLFQIVFADTHSTRQVSTVEKRDLT